MLFRSTASQHGRVGTRASLTVIFTPVPVVFNAFFLFLLTLSLPLWVTQPGSRGAEEVTQAGSDVGRWTPWGTPEPGDRACLGPCRSCRPAGSAGPRAPGQWVGPGPPPGAESGDTVDKTDKGLLAVPLLSRVFLRPHGLQPARLLCPGDSADKNTGAGCHALLQGIFQTQG